MAAGIPSQHPVPARQAAARLLVLPVGDEQVASTRYRVLAHLPALQAAGFETRLRWPLGLATRNRLKRRIWRILDLIRDVAGRREAEVVLLQRKLFPPALARRLPRAGQRLILDFDDAIDLPPPSVPPGPSLLARYRRNFQATAMVIDHALCGNARLAERLPHRRHTIIPTPVDTARFSPSALPPPEDLTLGWVGHSDNLPHLEALREPLWRLTTIHPGLRLIVCSDRPPRLPGIAVEYRQWNLAEEVSCFRGIRVGLMPLNDDAWTRGKCAFKAIQFLALGIPTVASPVGMAPEVVVDGSTGFLARDDTAWVSAVDTLLRNRQIWQELAIQGRHHICRHFSLEAISPRLVAALENVLKGEPADEDSPQPNLCEPTATP